MSQPNPFDHSQQAFPHHQPQPTPEEIAYRHGFQVGYTQGVNEAKLRYTQPTQRTSKEPSTNSMLTWSSLARFLTPTDYEIFSKIELDYEQADQLKAFAAIHLKSPLIATLTHLLIAPFSAGYFYLEKHSYGLFQTAISLAIGVPFISYSYQLNIRHLTELEQTVYILVYISNLVMSLVILFQVFSMRTWAREVNGQIIREWLQKNNLLDI